MLVDMEQTMVSSAKYPSYSQTHRMPSMNSPHVSNGAKRALLRRGAICLGTLRLNSYTMRHIHRPKKVLQAVRRVFLGMWT